MIMREFLFFLCLCFSSVVLNAQHYVCEKLKEDIANWNLWTNEGSDTKGGKAI